MLPEDSHLPVAPSAITLISHSMEFRSFLKSPPERERMKNRSPLVIVFFTVFLDLLGFGILIPL
nr:hypothetical protein [bacterium]